MVMGPIYNMFLPEECKITSATFSTTLTTLSPELTTFPPNTSIVTNGAECKHKENTALGMTMAMATAPVFLSLFASIIAGLLDKRREILMGRNLEEEPKVCHCI